MIVSSSLPVITKKEKTFNHIILYIDLDAFFASVEIRENPYLAGKPIIVGGDPLTRKGVVATCSYEARKFGIHSGMPVSQATQLCPAVIFVDRSYNLYSKVSKNIMKRIRNYSDKVRICSIDEAYIDITEKIESYKDAKRIAYEIKDEIYSVEKITCSIGIAPTKILAKIACGIDKPDGLTVIKPKDIKEFLRPLKISNIPGIGKKSELKYHKIGIKTCGDLIEKPIPIIYNKFGDGGIKLWKMIMGYNTEDVKKKFQERSRKSISEEHTFFESKETWREIWVKIEESINKIVSKAKERRMKFKTITLKIRNRKFETETRSYSLNCYTTLESVVKQVINKLLKEYKDIPASNIRLIGVKISNLIQIPDEQKNLTQFFNNVKKMK